MKKAFERVLLHVRPPKSGTTSIQHFLVNNRPALEKRGIYVPSAMLRGAQHIDVPLLFGPRREGLERLAGARIGSIDEQRASVVDAFAAEMANVAGGGALLLSSEHLFGASGPAIDAFRRLFTPYAERFESLIHALLAGEMLPWAKERATSA